MRDKKSHIYLDGHERSLLLHSLVELKNQLIQQGRYTDCVDELMQIEGQTGSIGHLRGDFGRSGLEFHTTWSDHRKQWKTDEFKSEFDEVIHALRSDEYGLLKDRFAMITFSGKQPDSAFKGNCCTEYGFRVDTEKHAYLLRCNPAKGDYNFYCHCYVSEWLDRHIEKASN